MEKNIEIHHDAIEKFEGEPRRLNLGTLDFLIYRVNRSRDVFRKAA